MNTLHALPTANLKGMGLLGQVIHGYIHRSGMTPAERLEHEKMVARTCRMPAANDAEFNPAPGVA